MRFAVSEIAPAVAVIVTTCFDTTGDVDILNVALVAPCATVTVAGSVATSTLLLFSTTTSAPIGASPESVTVPVDGEPPLTRVGYTDTLCN